MFSSHWTTLTVREFKHFAVQNSVWTKPKSWIVPCERSVRSNISAGRKFVRWRVNTYTLGDMSLQHFAAINHSVCTGRAISCCNKLRDRSQWQIARCVLRLVNSCANLCLSNRILSPQQVAQIQSYFWFFATCCPDKSLLRRQRFWQKFSSIQRAICRSDVSPQRVAGTCRLVCSDLNDN